MNRSRTTRPAEADLARKSASSARPAPRIIVPQRDLSSAIQQTTGAPANEYRDASSIAVLQRAIGNRATNGLLRRRMIQAKLTVGAVGDAYEKEADRNARQVVTMPAPLQRPDDYYAGNAYADGDTGVASSRAPISQRRAAPEEAVLAARADGRQSLAFDVGADFEGRLGAARSGGAPLPDSTRAFMESRMGADFGAVRVHTDAPSDGLNRSIQAKAFTTGQDVFFRAGAYDPGSRSGQELIAHELTHVAQQNPREVLAPARLPRGQAGHSQPFWSQENRPPNTTSDEGQAIRRHPVDFTTLIEEDMRIQRSSEADTAQAETKVQDAIRHAARQKKGTLLHNMGKAFTKGGLRTEVTDLGSKAAAQYVKGDTIQVNTEWAKDSERLKLQAILAHEVSHQQSAESGFNTGSFENELQAYRKQFGLMHPDWTPFRIFNAAIDVMSGRQPDKSLNYAWWSAEHNARALELGFENEYPESFNDTGNWKISRLAGLMRQASSDDAHDVLSFITEQRKGKRAWLTEARESKVGDRYALQYGNYEIKAREAIWTALDGPGNAPDEEQITGFPRKNIRLLEDEIEDKSRTDRESLAKNKKWVSKTVKDEWLDKVDQAIDAPGLSDALREQLSALRETGFGRGFFSD